MASGPGLCCGSTWRPGENHAISLRLSFLIQRMGIITIKIKGHEDERIMDQHKVLFSTCCVCPPSAPQEDRSQDFWVGEDSPARMLFRGLTVTSGLRVTRNNSAQHLHLADEETETGGRRGWSGAPAQERRLHLPCSAGSSLSGAPPVTLRPPGPCCLPGQPPPPTHPPRGSLFCREQDPVINSNDDF